MIYIGSDDGVYRLSEASPSEQATKVLDSGRVMRLRQFDGVDGVFAASKTGLFRSVDGDDWRSLSVPQEAVYAVVASSAGDRLYAGTRPAHLYGTTALAETGTGEIAWNEFEGFQDLPSRDEWRLPRHDDLAQVRDIEVDPGATNRLVAGVEVGGVHVSDDGGQTWTERCDGVHDDVHDLHVVGADEYVAATGDGLYRTQSAGRRWTRLDQTVTQRYFRRVFSIDDVVYASGALANSSTWDDDDADPALFACRDGTLEPLTIPTPTETVTGMTALDGELVVATHRGSLLVNRSGEWLDWGEFPVPGPLIGRYTPLTAVED